jgi:hypothetical protein
VTIEIAKYNEARLIVRCVDGCGSLFTVMLENSFGVTKRTMKKLEAAGWKSCLTFGRGVEVRCPECAAKLREGGL